MLSSQEAYPEDKLDALMYEGSLRHLTQFTQDAVNYAQRTISKARSLPLSEAAGLVLECAADAGKEGESGAANHLLNIIDGRGAGSHTFRANKLTECVEESLCKAYDDGLLHD